MITHSNLQSSLGYNFKDQGLLEEALRHPSMRQHDGKVMDYERLEFLGDSVLSFIITEDIFNRFKDHDEGKLARMRAFLVCKDTICLVADSLHLENEIVMTRGEELSGGRENPNNVENTMEAIVAAIYLDGGMTSAKNVVLRLWNDLLSDAQNIAGDPKSALQELSQGMSMSIPHYKIVSRTGQSHAPIFEIMVKVDDLEPEFGSGRSIKAAEKIAAEKLLKRLRGV
jgi:ribonuclease-3